MAFFTNPKTLYIGRICQLVLAIVFLVLICYGGVHRAWWSNINGALAVGVITSIFTFAITVHAIFTHHRSNPFAGGSTLVTVIRLISEIIILLLWIASAGLMLKPRTGCGNRHVVDGRDSCLDNEGHNPKRYDSQPLITWDVAIALSLAEAVSFIVSTLLVWKQEREHKSSGGTSYA